MDYDRYDAFLHHIFKQTQGDGWVRPNADIQSVSTGVALRINDDGDFRVFPYELAALEPFELAVRALNPVVAVKVRSAAVHAAMSDIKPDDKSLYIDSNTRIQIIDTMMLLPHAEREQMAAFIRDERVLVVWSESLEAIIPTCREFEDQLIKLLWRSHGGSQFGPVTPSISADAASMHGSVTSRSTRYRNAFADDLEMEAAEKKEKMELAMAPKQEVVWKRTWYGKKVRVVKERDDVDIELAGPERRPTKLYAPVYNGLAAAAAIIFVGRGVEILVQEWRMDGSFVRFALLAIVPLLLCVSLFFTLQIVQNITMALGPINHYHDNSKYYSAKKPRPNKLVDNSLPHITIQMPVYKESLDTVLAPSIESLKKAMQTYARQGGTSAIFVNDDGLRLIPTAQRDARIAYYANHNIGWVARPKHDGAPGGFKRPGRFKKASNMNYALALSLKAERRLEMLTAAASSPHAHPYGAPGEYTGYGMQYQQVDGGEQGVVPADAEAEDLEEKALGEAIEDIWQGTGQRFRPWAANGRSCRLGEIILIVDSDTIVPEDCLRDAARELAECPTVAVIQHESDVMQVAHHYFENGIAYFTRRINRTISMACANGEVAPFVGHNAFLRWKAIQDAAFVDPADGQEKIWSESNVSEDFDMALRLQLRGYIIRWATYANGGFKEGVSLTVDDELNRWQKYAYGCSELLFNPFVQWFRRGPIAHQIHRFIWSNAPLHYKISMLAYMFSYYGIASSVTLGILNYIVLGWQLPIDGFYMHGFEIWLATTVVFFGSGNVAYSLMEYRLGNKPLIYGFLESVMWIPFFFFFFGGLGIPVSQAILAHMFSYNITWGATIKEVERSNFFKEVPKICKRFWFPLIVSLVLIVGMIINATPLIPVEWRVDSTGWAVIFPLAVPAVCHILFPIVLNPWLMIFSY